MAYTVVIKYTGVEKDVANLAAPICGTYVPTNSYVDTPVFQNGYPVDVVVDSMTEVGYDKEKKYGKSIYANNVDDKFGYADAVEPFASTSIPFPVALSQFKLAVVGEDNQVTFDVEDYKEAFFYKDMGVALKDQGFEVTVSPKS